MYHTLSLALRMLTLVVGLALLIPATSYGADRDVNIRWNPSPSEGVTHYVLGVGVGAGTYLSQITMTDPTIDGDVWSRVVPLDDSADQYLALRAADGGGLYSIYSNEIVVASDDPNP